MNTEDNKFDGMLNHFDGQWDTEEPAAGHQDRFLNRLEKKKRKPKGLIYWVTIPAAAAIVILLSMMFIFTPKDDVHMAKISPKTEQTQMYFATLIHKELEKVQKENTPETKAIVEDAMLHMQQLEKDYEKITHELAKKGESKQLIHAMITNLQTRISFLEDVLVKIEDIKKIKETYHENYRA